MGEVRLWGIHTAGIHLIEGNIDLSRGSSRCRGANKDADLRDGTKVILLGAGGVVAGRGRMASPRYEAVGHLSAERGHCTWTVDMSMVLPSPRYEIAVGARPPIPIDPADLSAFRVTMWNSSYLSDEAGPRI